MDIKYKEDIDIENHGLSSATDKGNLLSEIQNSNIDVKIKIEKDSEDLNKVDLLNKHDKIRIKEDPDSANNIKNEPVSNEVSAIYIKQEIEDEDSAKEKNPDPTDDKSGKEDDDGKAAKHKTRTEFQYRVTYTPRQRIELEKEFAMEKFVSLRRKSQLARDLDLSERQVKIWFQNRRSKERKHKKRVCKGEEQAKTGHISSIEPQVSLAKTQLDSIDRIKNNILLVQQLQQSVLSRLLAHNYRNEPEN